jgi:hypothetical protein
MMQSIALTEIYPHDDEYILVEPTTTSSLLEADDDDASYDYCEDAFSAFLEQQDVPNVRSNANFLYYFPLPPDLTDTDVEEAVEALQTEEFGAALRISQEGLEDVEAATPLEEMEDVEAATSIVLVEEEDQEDSFPPQAEPEKKPGLNPTTVVEKEKFSPPRSIDTSPVQTSASSRKSLVREVSSLSLRSCQYEDLVLQETEESTHNPQPKSSDVSTRDDLTFTLLTQDDDSSSKTTTTRMSNKKRRKQLQRAAKKMAATITRSPSRLCSIGLRAPPPLPKVTRKQIAPAVIMARHAIQNYKQEVAARGIKTR